MYRCLKHHDVRFKPVLSNKPEMCIISDIIGKKCDRITSFASFQIIFRLQKIVKRVGFYELKIGILNLVSFTNIYVIIFKKLQSKCELSVN